MKPEQILAQVRKRWRFGPERKMFRRLFPKTTTKRMAELEYTFVYMELHGHVHPQQERDILAMLKAAHEAEAASV